MTEAPGSSSIGSATSIKLRQRAQDLLDALEDERRNHGDLVTPQRRRAESKLREALGEADAVTGA